VVQELSSNLIVIEKLQSFQYKDPNMRDHGENVRHRAKQLCELVMDPERVREERKKVILWFTGRSDCVRGPAKPQRCTCCVAKAHRF
jgi:ENTH domain